MGFAVLDWLARDQDPATLGSIIAGNLIANAISAVVHLNAVTSGLHNVRGWGPVALYPWRSPSAGSAALAM